MKKTMAATFISFLLFSSVAVAQMSESGHMMGGQQANHAGNQQMGNHGNIMGGQQAGQTGSQQMGDHSNRMSAEQSHQMMSDHAMKDKTPMMGHKNVSGQMSKNGTAENKNIKTQQ